MDVNGPEALLERIARVDPPPFLFTRIEARLMEVVQVPRARIVVVACGLALLLLANAVVLTRASRATGASSLGDVAGAMGMNASNQLY
jgi:hypothetical protein